MIFLNFDKCIQYYIVRMILFEKKIIERYEMNSIG